MKKLIILGCGSHAHEMADIVDQINRTSATWEFLGFLAPETQAEQASLPSDRGGGILGTCADFVRYPDAWFVPEYNCGCPNIPRARLVSLVAPSAFVARSAQIGAGSVIYPHCFVGYHTVLGEQNFVLSGSVINHDICLENNVTVCSGVTLAGFVHVEPGSYLGQACTIKQYVRIGKGSLIGMGSVVIHDVPPNSVMVGNPARRLRNRV